MLTQIISKEKARAQSRHQIHIHLGSSAVVKLYLSLVRSILSLIKHRLWGLSCSSGVCCGQGLCATCKVTCIFRRIVVLRMVLDARSELWRCPREVDVTIAVVHSFKKRALRNVSGSAERHSSYCFDAVRMTGSFSQ